MDTWRERLPTGWEYTGWLPGTVLPNDAPLSPLMLALRDKGEWNGVADLLRWTLLDLYGGIYVDADAECLRWFPDSMLAHRAFSCWENEVCRPGLVACGVVGAVPGSRFVKTLIARVLHESASDVYAWSRSNAAWRLVGPGLVTRTLGELGADAAHELHVYPAALFLPSHYTGTPPAPCADPPICRHYWGSTVGSSHAGYAGLR
jgi:hypothetical protein